MLDRADVLPNALARRAVTDPDRVFVRHVDGTDWTYARLERRVLGWAAAMHAQGVRAGDRVVVMLPNSLDSIAVWMAAARLGAIEVPANTAYRLRFLEHLVTNAAAACAVVSAGFVERFAEIEDDVPALERLLVIGDVPAVTTRLALVPARDAVDETVDAASLTLVEPEEHEISTIVYTSGTTGASKGALIPWAQVHHTATACPPTDDLDETDVRYSPYPMFHISGKLALCSSALLNGTLVVRETFSTRSFWPDVDRFGVTTTLLVGAVGSFMWAHPERPDDADHTLRNVLFAPPPEDPMAFCRRFGLRGSVVFNMTELSCPTSTGWDQELVARRCMGRVRDGYQVQVVDDLDRPLPAGEIGEIVVRSDEPWRLMQGYFGMDDKTVEAWRNLWFHTGDLGRFDEDGALTFLDRKKDAIRRRGENISSMELEAEVCVFPAVAEAAVVGVPSEVGEDDVKIFVVPRPDVAFDPAALVEFLEARVPAFMLPRYVAVIDALPKTPTEKVKKQELKLLPADERTWERPAVTAR